MLPKAEMHSLVLLTRVAVLLWHELMFVSFSNISDNWIQDRSSSAFYFNLCHQLKLSTV